jgi:hypothetical protein
MIQRELGTLSRIDARQVWADEARDFTPWLRENISVLGEALGLDLDLVNAEVAVGPFACDLVAKDVAHDRWVVIENQLEATDHGHLGQLLTYGAGVEAAVFVWISPKFRDEHRAAIDWLNEHSDDASAFFAVEIEVLTIDNTHRAAPNFKLVSSPNEWVRDRRPSSGSTSSRQAAYESFFNRLLVSFKERFPHETSVSRASPQSWLALSIGRSGFQTGWAFTGDRRFRVEVYIDRESGTKEYFDSLKEHQAAIESSLGHPLDWDRLDGRRACRISSYYPAQSAISVLAPEEQLEAIAAWAVDEMKKVRDVFRAHIQALPAIQ